MQPPESSTDGSPSPTRRQLQGPRPPQLRVRKDSHVIKKPPIVPQPHAPPRPPAEGPSQNRQPVIIYAVSPKVIHTTATDFMSLVQRLTGSSSSDQASGSGNRGDVSPAARLASIERTSPRPKEREKDRQIGNDIMGMVEGIEMGQNPGILSPAPGTLPPISPGFFFSPRSDPHGYSILQDLSSPLFNQGNMFMPSPLFNQGSVFMPSPSTLFSAPMASPSPSSFDLFNQQFFDFQ